MPDDATRGEDAKDASLDAEERPEDSDARPEDSDAQPDPPPPDAATARRQRVLFVGNSFVSVNDVPARFRGLVGDLIANDVKFDTRKRAT